MSICKSEWLGGCHVVIVTAGYTASPSKPPEVGPLGWPGGHQIHTLVRPGPPGESRDFALGTAVWEVNIPSVGNTWLSPLTGLASLPNCGMQTETKATAGRKHGFSVRGAQCLCVTD